MSVLVDTSVLVELEHGASAEGLPAGEEILVSVVSIMELQVGIESAQGRRRVRRQAYLDHVFETYTVALADAQTSVHAGQLFWYLEHAGQRIGYSDTWIAAAALTYGHDVLTANARHFRRVPGLHVIPWDGDSPTLLPATKTL